MSELPLTWIQPDTDPIFPSPSRALKDPDGLLAFGGSLEPSYLLEAYRQGIFPWYNENDPILWWSPDPRCVFDTFNLPLHRSLRKKMRQSSWEITWDRAFTDVMKGCAAPRQGQQDGTWITSAMIGAYTQLHQLGHAHSIELWQDNTLIGGLYGIAIGQLFCGESMFGCVSNASQMALVATSRLLRQWHMPLLDAQVANPHLHFMGAKTIPRQQFIETIQQLTHATPHPQAFQLSSSLPIPLFTEESLSDALG